MSDRLKALAAAFYALPREEKERRIREHTGWPETEPVVAVLDREAAHRSVMAELVPLVNRLENESPPGWMASPEPDPDALSPDLRDVLARAGGFTEMATLIEEGLLGMAERGDGERVPFRIPDVMLGIDTSEWLADPEEPGE